MTRHRLFNPEGMAPATGFFLWGNRRRGSYPSYRRHDRSSTRSEYCCENYRAVWRACRGVARVIDEAGGTTSDLVSMTIYTSSVDEYRANLEEIGVAYRGVFGKHFPPMALIGIRELFDPSAKVELVCVAVVPQSDLD